MANMQNTTSGITRSFEKNLNEDIKDFHQAPGSWTQARNAINNSKTGDLGDLGNEPANKFCTKAPYTIIGSIHIIADQWIIFSTDDTDSEIGVFVEGDCSYRTVVNDQCLNFKKTNLIIGVSKINFDCSYSIYFDDGLNPSRVVNIGNPDLWPTVPYIGNNYYQGNTLWPGVAWNQNCVTDINGCVFCTDLNSLNCDNIRLAKLITLPCFKVTKGATGGELLNGTYYVVAAYTINQQKIGDYSMPSNLQPLFIHTNIGSSLDIEVTQADLDFEEFELVLVSTVNQQTVARRMGIYSTRIKNITIDIIDNRWTTVPIEQIPIRTPIADKSDGMYENGGYLLRVGPTDKFDFNYQPRANRIKTKWVSVEYPGNYYEKGGNQVGYCRDEVYAFFIRWVYNTGDKSASYHIPGRYGTPNDFSIVGGADATPETSVGITPYNWIVYNTAPPVTPVTQTLPDGGVVIAKGEMAYWESTERYDDNKPNVWNANVLGHPEWDLCGKPIRHHKFPENCTDTGNNLLTNHYSPGGDKIRVMGVEFTNILPPVDENGNVITNIVAYEILRGSREGNKTIIAKGMINNMYEYDIPNSINSTRTGLYANYPYNPRGVDYFISTTETTPGCGTPNNYTANGARSRQFFTFHSPDTQFKNPFLAVKEIKVYGELNGSVEGGFGYPNKHPKHKLLTDLAFLIAVLSGAAIALTKLNGTRKVKYVGPRAYSTGFAGAAGADLSVVTAGTASAGVLSTMSGIEALNYEGTGIALGFAILGLSNTSSYSIPLQSTASAAGLIPGVNGGYTEYENETGINKQTPAFLQVLYGVPTFLGYWNEGVSTVVDFIYAIIPFRQYALQYISHGFYNQWKCKVNGNTRRIIEDSIYTSPTVQDFTNTHRINNILRNRSVALKTNIDILDTLTVDDTRRDLANAPAGPTYADPTVGFRTTAASHYCAIKQRLRNQYGQIEGIIEVPVTTCGINVTLSRFTNPNQYLLDSTGQPATSGVLFNGDIYIGRYTEKNTMYFFDTWMYDQPDGYEFDYRDHQILPWVTYRMNTEKFDFEQFTSCLISNILTPSNWATCFPSGNRVLDRASCPIKFGVKDAYMYLFNSGVRDFYVESEVNVGLRDWGDNDEQKHYPILDYPELFNTDLIRAGNYYKYDYSLSASRIYNNFFSWGNVQSRNYDPLVASTCYVYDPNKIIYSLQDESSSKQDRWQIFLPNNYYSFTSKVTCVKTINKSGALIMFETESPVQFQGTDQLQTDLGTKLTIGDGGLFSQPLQNMSNADRPYEYGSCQNRLSVINTPSGIYYMSQNQGKIFQITGGLNEISTVAIRWWLASYLPYQLTKQFPDFELTDNPVIGIGCQSAYDNENALVYFCKKDYVLKPGIPDTITYVGADNFLVNDMLPIKLGDPNYFEDASWTLSYDPKTKNWLSYHDWHPSLILPGKNTFMSVSNTAADPNQNNGIWVHNSRCDLYCNYYGVDYPFEVEFTANTVQTVNTLRSIEYILESYIYSENCFDRFHRLDFNFDEAVIYNTEQCSGLLRLNLTPKNNAPLIVQYPIVNVNTIDILYSKEENKYRFNQFWDITRDRGEFALNSGYPPVPTIAAPGGILPATTYAEQMIWNTQSNGYIRVLNNNNLNYTKDPLQRKKFRHYTTSVLLRRRISGNVKMLVLLTNTKNLLSSR